jgi:hypothetical protein
MNCTQKILAVVFNKQSVNGRCRIFKKLSRATDIIENLKHVYINIASILKELLVLQSCYWLLLQGGVEQSVANIAAIFDLLCVPI